MRRLVLMLLLAGCNHSPVVSWTRDPGDVWDQGPPIRLTPHRVTFHNFTADGSGILILRRFQPTRSPAGEIGRDTSDIGLGLLPISGGGGTWDFINQRRGQGDSTNRIISAALSTDNRLLYVEETGPLVFNPDHYPVFWHQELSLSRPGAAGPERRLLQLFDEVGGQSTVPPGAINVLVHLQWLDQNRFLASAGHRFPMPKQDSTNAGLVVGTITPDTARLEVIHDLLGIERFSPTPDGAVLLQSTRSLWLLSIPDKRQELLTTFSSTDERVVLTSRCDLSVCWAIVLHADDPPGTWEVWQVDRATREARFRSKVVFFLGATPLLPPTGRALIASHQGLLYRIDDALPE
jgi:hypothetical protein